jgi:rubrerythrin
MSPTKKEETDMDKTMGDQWRELSEHILREVQTWRKNHPKATFREIEEEVHSRMSRLEAQLLEAAVQESPSRDWSGASAQERPSCPVCRSPLQARGKRKRILQGAGGQSITLQRAYGTCPTCGTGLFPPR